MVNKARQVTSGLIWTYAERITAQLITILVTIILARKIPPNEYGIISIVSVFINIANAFVVSGFGNSLIQKKEADEIDFSTVFWFSILFSIIIYAGLFSIAPIIASFYSMPQLSPIIRIMSLRLPIAAINSIQQAFISKRMEFKKFFFATIGGTIISAIIGINMAYRGYGIWSLVVQYLTNVCIDTIVLSFISGWKPKILYSKDRMNELFSYGWKIMIVGVMTTLYSNLRNLIIGKKYSSADLAFCEKGEQFPAAVAGNINSSITKVLFPVLSEAQNDIAILKRMVRRSIKVGSYILFPLMYGFMVLSNTFIRVFLTDTWIGCAPFLKIMCIVYSLQPLQTAALQSMKALGESGLYLKVDIIKKVFGVAILILSVTCFDNVYYVVLGALIVEVVSVLILMPFNKKLLNYTYMEQVRDIMPVIVLTSTMCIVVSLFNLLSPFSDILELLFDILIGALIYIAMSVITKNENFVYILNIVKGRLL